MKEAEAKAKAILSAIRNLLFETEETPKIKKKIAKIELGKVREITSWNIEVNEDVFEVGSLLTVTYYDGVKDVVNPLADGEYELENGTNIQVNNEGKIVLVTPKTEMAKTETKQIQFMEVKTTDGKSLKIDKMEVGGIVTIDDVAAPDASYELEDGSIIACVDGLISEITEAPTEESELEKANKTIEELKLEIASLKFSIQEKETELASTPAATPIIIEASKETKVSPEMAKYQAYQAAVKQQQK